MLIDRDNLHVHLKWITFCVVATIASAAWYFVAAAAENTLPSGSSLPGFTFGVVGGLICIFEFLFWPRKMVRGWRVGRAQTWLRAHIWLGLLSLPVVVLHTGFRFGGDLSTVLLLLFIVVIASGVYGLFLQQLLPRRILSEVPAETIYSQIDVVSEQFADEARRIVRATCGDSEGDDEDHEAVAVGAGAGAGLTIGRVRSAGRVQGKVLEKLVIPDGEVAGAGDLLAFHDEHIEPFLRDGEESGSSLRFGDRATAMFGDLRTRVGSEAHSVVGALEGLCDQRRQFSRQARLHRRLHSWLWIHLPLSMALIFLLFVHIIVAMKWW